MKKFETPIEVRWSDVDQNRHVRHSAYYDYGAHVRMRFFNERGFNSKMMHELQLGPILFKEECSFIRELHSDERIIVSLLRGDISEDGSRWVLHHEIYNSKGEKSAHITARGAWMDLKLRKLTIPPKELAIAVQELPAGSEYTYKKLK